MGPESYVLSSVFGQVFAKYGLLAAVLALVAFVLVGLLAYYIKARIELMRADAATRATEREKDLARRDADAAKRDAERQQLIQLLREQGDSIQAQNKEIQRLLTNHLAHDEASRDHLTTVLVRAQTAMEAVAFDLKAHREEEGRRASQAHEDMGAVKTQLAVLEKGQERAS